MHRLALATAAALALPTAALAQLVSGHTAPHVIKQGTTSKPTSAGIVVVQVYVPATGAPKVGRILKSTNHADDAGALDIAHTATFATATLDGKPHSEYFDFEIKFLGQGAVAAPPAGTLASFEAMIKQNKFDDAKTGLTGYLASHPTDEKAQLDLALDETYLNDDDDAAVIYAKATTIPPALTTAAHHSLIQASADDVKAKKTDEALAYAKRAVDVTPDYGSYAALGQASLSSGDNAGAEAAFEKAVSLGASAPAGQRAILENNLAVADLAAGDVDKAKAAQAQAKSIDPSVASVDTSFGNYYATIAQTKSKAGDDAGAAKAFESAAAADPADAVTLETNAAFSYLKMKPADNAAAKSAADQALKADPTSAEANFAAGIALAQMNRQTEALTFLEKADGAAKAQGKSDLATQIETNIHALAGAK